MKRRNLLTITAIAAFSLLVSACDDTDTKPTTQGSEPTSQVSSQPGTTSVGPGSSSHSPIPSSSSGAAPVVTVQSIEIDDEPPLHFYVNDEFSVEGGTITVHYSNGSENTINMTLDMIPNKPSMDVASPSLEVTVSYGGQITTYNIEIEAVDTRTEVTTLGIVYNYNGKEEEPASDGLIFREGKTYSFGWETDPVAAHDSIDHHYYLMNGDEVVQQLDAKPTTQGEYMYAAYIPNNDLTYKPIRREIKYRISYALLTEFILDEEDTPDVFTDTFGDYSDLEVEPNLIMSFGNVKKAAGSFAVLGKTTDAEVNPTDSMDNYIELKSEMPMTTSLKVEFEGENDYVYAYGSFDGIDFNLLDTFTKYHTVTDALRNYNYFRLVAAPRGGTEVAITKIQFTADLEESFYSQAQKAEQSDLFNTTHSPENNAYFHKSTQVWNPLVSTKGIGITMGDNGGVFVDLGFTIPFYQVPFYQFSFKAKPAEGTTYEKVEDHTPKTESAIFVKAAYQGATKEETAGTHKSLFTTMSDQTEWVSYTVQLTELFPSEDYVDISMIKIWNHRKCTTGSIYYDDFRLIQTYDFPCYNEAKLEKVWVEDVNATEFNQGDPFQFDGKIFAEYTNRKVVEIPSDDPRVTITPPTAAYGQDLDVTVSVTEEGRTRGTSYKINITPTSDPELDEILPICDDSVDLAAAANQSKSGRDYDIGKTRDNTTDTYGASTNSLDVYNLKADDYYMNLALPSALTKDSIHVKFFAKNLPDDGIYVQLLNRVDVGDKDATMQRALVAEGQTKTSVNTKQSSTYHFTATDAGNGWTMFEYDYYAANVTDGVSFIRFSTSKKLDKDYTIILDGIEVS